MSSGQVVERPERSHARTYVVQVQSGREQRAKILIERMLPKALLDEIFIPTYVKQVKRAGEWREEKALLVPGYLYLNTRRINAVAHKLRSVPALTKVLGTEAQFIPLTREELSWLEELTEPGKRSIGISKGVIEGDQVHILGGPLRGHEALIRKVNRHKRIAEIEFHILGRTASAKVGLEILAVN